ncbi:putative vps53-like protein [Helianthus annuus]|nr:putative vps53-like protein [Helianthus annuus]
MLATFPFFNILILIQYMLVFDSVVFDVLKYSAHFFKRSTQFVVFVAKQSRTKGSRGSGSIRDIKKLHFTKHIPTTITTLHLLTILGLEQLQVMTLRRQYKEAFAQLEEFMTIAIILQLESSREEPSMAMAPRSLQPDSTNTSKVASDQAAPMNYIFSSLAQFIAAFRTITYLVDQETMKITLIYQWMCVQIMIHFLRLLFEENMYDGSSMLNCHRPKKYTGGFLKGYFYSLKFLDSIY